MSSSAVWVDSEHARIFKFVNGDVETHHLQNIQPLHHTFNMRDDMHASDRFYHELAEYLERNADELLLMGPGVGKKHFKTHLDKHHKNLAKKVIGVKAFEQAPDFAIIEAARKVFQDAHLYSK